MQPWAIVDRNNRIFVRSPVSKHHLDLESLLDRIGRMHIFPLDDGDRSCEYRK